MIIEIKYFLMRTAQDETLRSEKMRTVAIAIASEALLAWNNQLCITFGDGMEA